MITKKNSTQITLLFLFSSVETAAPRINLPILANTYSWVQISQNIKENDDLWGPRHVAMYSAQEFLSLEISTWFHKYSLYYILYLYLIETFSFLIFTGKTFSKKVIRILAAIWLKTPHSWGPRPVLFVFIRFILNLNGEKNSYLSKYFIEEFVLDNNGDCSKAVE